MSQHDIDQIVNAVLSDATHPPDTTFGSILKQITYLLQDFPEEERTSRRRKLMCVLEKKFAALLDTDQESNVLNDDKKKLVGSVAAKIAAWMEGVIVEAESRMDSQCSGLQSEAGTGTGTGSAAESVAESQTLQVQPSDVYEVVRGEGSCLAVENLARRRASQDRATMTDVMEILRAWDLKGPEEGTSDMHSWAEWIGGVMKMAEDWGSWINQTVSQAKLKAAMKRGELLSSQGELERLTRADWTSWKQRISIEATNFRRVNQSIQHTAQEWSKLFGDSVKANQNQES